MKNLKYLILLSSFIYWSFQCFSQEKKYNQVFEIACHNCYDPQYTDSIEKVFVYTSVIEFDIWDNKINSGAAGRDKMDKDWYVKHKFNTDGNLNCCGGTFKDCLIRIKIWGDKNPNHDAVTVFIDKKENWSEPYENRKPNDLDELLLSIFSKEKIFTPSDLLNNHPNLKNAVTANKWLILDSLKGKFIFVITDATIQLDIPIISPHRTPLNEYLDAQKNKAICFVAPQISNEQEIVQPDGFSKENSDNVVFYNLSCVSSELAEKINLINCVSRIFDCDESKETYEKLVAKKVNFIAMHNYKLNK